MKNRVSRAPAKGKIPDTTTADERFERSFLDTFERYTKLADLAVEHHNIFSPADVRHLLAEAARATQQISAETLLTSDRYSESYERWAAVRKAVDAWAPLPRKGGSSPPTGGLFGDLVQAVA